MSGFLAATSSASYTKSTRIEVLPAEILSHIFIILTESNLYDRSIGKKNCYLVHYPILLSSVCSRWRRIALHTSCLWSLFDVRRPGQSRIEPSLLNCFLERSREAPLRVRLGGYTRFLTRDTVEGLAASILQSGGSRLRSLGIFHELLESIIKVLLLVSSQDIVVPLRELALGTRRKSQFDYIATEPEGLFQNGLSTLFEPLHALHLKNIWLNWDIFPCQNLVELQLTDQPGSRFPTGMRLATILRANPRLQLLVLQVRFSVVDAQTFEHTTEPIRLPMLQRLDLRAIESFVVDFLGLLFPTQRGFHLRLANSSQEGNGQKTIAALEKLSHRTEITWLHILDKWLKVLTGSYGSLRNLRHLILMGYGILGETVDGMSQAVNCLSRLNTITLVGYNVDKTTLSKVLSWNSSNSLQAVRLQACRFWDGDEVPYEDVAASFVEKGLDGIVTHSNDLDLYEFSSSFFL